MKNYTDITGIVDYLSSSYTKLCNPKFKYKVISDDQNDIKYESSSLCNLIKLFCFDSSHTIRETINNLNDEEKGLIQVLSDFEISDSKFTAKGTTLEKHYLSKLLQLPQKADTIIDFKDLVN